MEEESGLLKPKIAMEPRQLVLSDYSAWLHWQQTSIAFAKLTNQ